MFHRQHIFILLAMMAAEVAGRTQPALCISELLFQPRSGEAEYIELHNAGNTALDLSDYTIVRWVGDSLGRRYELPQHTVAPGGYVVLTKNRASVAAGYNVKYMEALVECDLPPYPNDGGSVILAKKEGGVVERLDYAPSMHSRLLRNKAGVALERRSFERPCNEAGNWFSAASTAGYGTPGYANSQSTEWLAEEASFDFSSTLVSPDGDGYQDDISIVYHLEDSDLMGNMVLYNARGQQVRRLLNDGLLGTHGEMVWDGRGEGGEVLPSGRYILYINLYNQHGTKQTIKRVLSLVAQ